MERSPEHLDRAAGGGIGPGRAGAAATPPFGYAEHTRTIAILMAGHNLRRLNWWYRAFKGDLLLPLVLGEIALRGTARKVAPNGPARVGAAERSYRLAGLSIGTGIPRESARRIVRRLLELGWISKVAQGEVVPSARAIEYFGFEYNRQMLDDFLWSAGRLREVLAFDPSERKRGGLRQDLGAALATRVEDLPRPRFSIQFEPPPACLPQELSRQLTEIAWTLGEYGLRHLKRLRRGFGGDLLLPLLLGEIAHYNIASLMYRTNVDLATLDALVEGEEGRGLLVRLLSPCNAYSLGLATGVPDSTVRRKIAVLVERGWVAATPQGAYIVTGKPREEFEDVNLQTLGDFLVTEERLRQVLEGARK